MGLQAPPIDPRKTEDVFAQTSQLLNIYLSAYAPDGWKGGEAGLALTRIFAHFCQLIIDRLNRTPDNHFLAFLDLLGNSPIPAGPAHTALTFSLVPAAKEATLLPARTQVQAEPQAGAIDAIVFETDRDLWLTPLTLAALRVGTNANDPRDLGGAGAILDTLIAAPIESGVGLFDKAGANVEQAYYFGLRLPAGMPLVAGIPVEIYLFIDSPGYDPASWLRNMPAPDALAWQYCNGLTDGKPCWAELPVEDETEAFTLSGSLRFLVPADLHPTCLWEGNSSPSLGWLRARRSSRSDALVYRPAPRLRCAALNTVPATQAVSIGAEVLGSSTASQGLQLSTARRPVLPGARLEVMERRGVRAPAGAAATPDEWVPWSEVPHFHASGPLDRHYVLDHVAGRVMFGDGRRGMVPPSGTRNIRMAGYRFGGGATGNVPPGALKTLLAGSRLVSKVTNLLPAEGGIDAEDTPALEDRAPRSLRHRNRAVTAEDYEDLARLCTTEVARARCIPLQNLARDPDSDPDAPYRRVLYEADERDGVGEVSVIIVPRSTQARPLPSPALMRRVQAYLAERASAEARVTVVGPLYLQIDIEIEVSVSSMLRAPAVARELSSRFDAWLHPLTGRGGAGWPFGRLPYPSDLYRLIADVPGLDHVDRLSIIVARELDDRDRRRIEDTQRFLVCSGAHKITPVAV